MQKEIQELLRFIQDSPSPYHTVASAGERFREAGFEALDMAASWQLCRGGRYFVPVYGSTVLAFAVGGRQGRCESLRHIRIKILLVTGQSPIVSANIGLF